MTTAGPATPRPLLERGSGDRHAWRDLLVIALIVAAIDAVAAVLLVYVYFPARRAEALARTPAQLALLARDRQNALTAWVRERAADAALTASLLAAAPGRVPAGAPELLDRFVRAYGYESALLVGGAGSVLLRRGSTETDDPTIVQFARETMNEPAAKIDFRRTAKRKPKILTACSFASASGRAAVVFVSDPYDYVYPLFSTFTTSRTGETNLIGVSGDWGLALNPYPEGSPPPMTLRRYIGKAFSATAFGRGERSFRYVDRREKPVIGVVKQIPLTPWVLVAKIDEDEAVAGAVDETARFGELLGFSSLALALAAVVILRSRRVRRLRAAEDQLARLFENSTTGILVMQVILGGGGAPIDHQVVDMNPAAERLLGVTAGQEIGKRSAQAQYLRWTSADRADNYEVALRGTSIQYEQFDATLERWFETTCFSPRHGQFAHLFTDITERKKSEEALRRLSARLLRVQDEERRRIARQLHETVAQMLAALRMNLAVIRRSMTDGGSTAAIVDDSVTTVDEALAETRTLSYLLHPPMIDQAGLLTTLRWYVDGFEQRSGIATTLHAPDDLGRLPPDIETSIFSIIQESLTNVQRHAGSATASVSIERLEDRLSIEIADRGHGLPANMRDDRDALLASGVGIAGINERTRDLHGDLMIHSSETGMRLRVTLPVG